MTKTVYNVASYLEDAVAENIIPILNQVVTTAHSCWKASEDGVSEVLFKLQPALNDIHTVIANWSIMIQDFVITSCDVVSLFIQNTVQYFIYCIHEILKILIAIYEFILRFIVVTFKNTLNHYHQNKKQPRLFSQVFKQMIKQIKWKSEEIYLYEISLSFIVVVQLNSHLDKFLTKSDHNLLFFTSSLNIDSSLVFR